MGRLEGKSAIIFGAGGGIGQETTRYFATEGAKVIIADISREAGLDLENRLCADGCAVQFVCADVTSGDEVREAMQLSEHLHGGLDIACNFAGGSSSVDGLIEMTSDEEFWRTIRVDLYGTWLVCKYAVAVMRRRGGGSIINMASVAGLAGPAGVNAYAAAKGGVISLTRALAVGYASSAIRVNACGSACKKDPVMGVIGV